MGRLLVSKLLLDISSHHNTLQLTGELNMHLAGHNLTSQKKAVECILVHSNDAIQSCESCATQVTICVGNSKGLAQQLVLLD